MNLTTLKEFRHAVYPCFERADRSAQHVHNLPVCDKPVTYGWQFLTLVILPHTPGSWT